MTETEQLQKEQLKHQKENLSLFSELAKGQNTLIALGHEIVGKQAKHTLFLSLAFFVAGVLVGMQYKVWIPYAYDVYSIVKGAKEIKESAK